MVSSATGLARVLTDGAVFERVRLAETEYERSVCRFGPTIFPGWTLAAWKPEVKTVDGRVRRPDAIMWDSETLDWYVIEIELASHPVDGHIRPQLSDLRRAVYTPSLAPSVSAATGKEAAVASAMLSRRPGFLCIVDGESEDVRLACLEYEFEYAVAEPLKSDTNHFALRVLAVPQAIRRGPAGPAWRLRPAPALMGTVAVHLPAAFPQGPITVEYEGDRYPVKEIPLAGHRILLLPFLKELEPFDFLEFRMLDPSRRVMAVAITH